MTLTQPGRTRHGWMGPAKRIATLPSAPPKRAATSPAERSAPSAAAVAPARRMAWTPYLVLVTALVPLVVPGGLGQTAIADAVNVVVLVAFATRVLVGRRPVALPLIGPVMLISASSLLAVSHAESVQQSVLTLAQDLYLYLWFVMLVTLMRAQGDTRTVRIAWLWSANLYAIVGLAVSWVQNHGQWMSILSSSGIRAASTLYNPNMFADYLVLSLFVMLSLIGRYRAWLIAGSVALALAALVATKSNGGMTALGAGIVAWTLTRLALRPARQPRTLAGVLLALAILGGAAWLASETGLAENALGGLREKTFVGRMSHSLESRKRIWEHLQQSYARSPIGIGPGNSGSITVSLAERERPGSFLSKEAHSDYLAYAIERGPVAFVGLLLLIGMVFAQLFRTGRALRNVRTHVTAAWIAAMTGALVASTVHSTVIEKLHFRHFWLGLALVCAVRGRPADPKLRIVRPVRKSRTGGVGE